MTCCSSAEQDINNAQQAWVALREGIGVGLLDLKVYEAFVFGYLTGRASAGVQFTPEQISKLVELLKEA